MDVLHDPTDDSALPNYACRFPFSDLPVIKFSDEILKTIRRNDVTIISAETGAGKSTVIPWILFAIGKLLTWVTETRRVAAEALAGYGSAKNKTELGQEIGVRTAIQSKSSNETKLLYATDGWVLRKLLNIKKNKQKFPCDVLILDEIHEENKNLDLLIGLWKKWKNDGIKVPKLVLMSATIAIESLNKCFNNPPIFQIPGRTFEVEKVWEPTKSPIDIIFDEVALGRDCMVFLPGKYEIQEMQEILRERGLDAEILQLHREVEWPEQKKVFDKYDRPKVILSTDIGQTSITPDVDTVISLGIKRRVSLFDGIQRLCDMLCAEFDLIQQAGRAGRTKPDGKFILCSEIPSRMFAEAFKYFRGERRKEKEDPQILSSRLEMDYLYLKLAGENLIYLNKYLRNKIPNLRLDETIRRLIDFKAIDSEGAVTETGKQLAKYPCQIESAEIIRRSTSNDPKKSLEEFGIAIAAILEVGGILEVERGKAPDNQKWSKYYGDEKKSEILGHLNVFLYVLKQVIENDPSLEGLHLNKEIEYQGYKMGLKKRKVHLFIETLEMLGKYKRGHSENVEESQSKEQRGNSEDADWVLKKLINFVKSGEPKISGHSRTTLLDSMAYGLREFVFVLIPSDNGIKKLARVKNFQADDQIEYIIPSTSPLKPGQHDVVFGIPFELSRNGTIHSQLTCTLIMSANEVKGIGMTPPEPYKIKKASKNGGVKHRNFKNKW